MTELISSIFNDRATYLVTANENIDKWVKGLAYDSQFKWAQTYDIWISYTKCVPQGQDSCVPIFNGLSVPKQDFTRDDRKENYIARVLKSIVDNSIDPSKGTDISPITAFRVYLTFPRKPHKHRRTYGDKKTRSTFLEQNIGWPSWILLRLYLE